MKKIYRYEIAKAVGIAVGHLSDVLNEKAEVGKTIAKKLSDFTGVEWTAFLTMTGAEIETALLDAMRSQNAA